MAKDTDRSPCLLVSVSPGSGTRPAPVALEHLTVQHDVVCRVSRPGHAAEDAVFTVIRCTSEDAGLGAYFLGIGGAVVRLLGPSPSRDDVVRVVQTLVELFRAMGQPARKPAQGLWGELFLIARARSPETLLGAWHASPQDRYDFSAGAERIEVKTAAGGRREHHFTLQQLSPPRGTTLLVASLFVERVGGGRTLQDLAESVRARVGRWAELVLRLERVVVQTLGESWRSALEESFDFERAEESLQFFEPRAIPSVSPEVPEGVTEVRFRSDLTTRPSVRLSDYREAGGLFAAAEPA